MLRSLPALSLTAQPEVLFLGICLLASTLLTGLTYEECDGGLVPTVVFRGQAAAFQTFVLAILFTCAASASAIMHRAVFLGYPRFWRRAAGAALLVASAALTWCSFWWGFVLCVASVVAMRGGLKHNEDGEMKIDSEI